MRGWEGLRREWKRREERSALGDGMTYSLFRRPFLEWSMQLMGSLYIFSVNSLLWLIFFDPVSSRL